MAGTILCIVDMQKNFSSWEYCANEVKHQIALAKRRKDPIVVIEYDVFKKEGTEKSIIEAVEESGCLYDVEIKDRDNGSCEVLHACGKNGFDITKRIRLCGVNRNACVKDTAQGLAYMLPHTRIEVSWSATSNGQECEIDEKFYLEEYEYLLKHYSNLVIVP
jgi:hypothetical protein